MSMTLRISVLALLLLLSSTAARADMTVTVSCPGPSTLGDAIERAERRARPMVIEFDGSCTEDLTIRRDNLSIVGLSPTAELVGGIEVDGASGIRLSDFLVSNSAEHGIHLQRGAAAVLENLTVRDTTLNGIYLENHSFARLAVSSVLRSGGDGIGLLMNSALEVDGAVVSNENGGDGLFVSSNSTVQPSPLVPGSSLEVNDNNEVGIAIQLLSSVALFELTATGNGRFGVQLSGLSSLFANPAEISGNGSVGVVIEGFSTVLLLSANISDNLDEGVFCWQDSNLALLGIGGASTISSNGGYGVRTQDNCTILAHSGLQTSGHSIAGIFVDGSIANLSDTTALDPVILQFGSRADFGSGNTITDLTCDETVLVRGALTCPVVAAPVVHQPAAALRQRGTSPPSGPYLEPDRIFSPRWGAARNLYRPQPR